MDPELNPELENILQGIIEAAAQKNKLSDEIKYEMISIFLKKLQKH